MPANELNLLIDRLDQLEHKNRRLRQCAILALTTIIAIGVGGAVRNDEPNKVVATSFVLQDSSGQTRAVLQSLPGSPNEVGDTVRFALKDSNGKDTVTLSVDPNGKTNMNLGLTPDSSRNAGIKFFTDSKTSSFIDMYGDNHESHINVSTTNNNSIVTISGRDWENKDITVGIGSMVKGIIRVLGNDLNTLFEAIESN